MEHCRSTLEDAEALELAISLSLNQRKERGGQQARTNLDFKINAMLEDCLAKVHAVTGKGFVKELVKDERERIENGGMAEFYSEKRKISEYYAKHNDTQGLRNPVARSNSQLQPAWRGEEHHGRYLDLHVLYNTYLNLKNVGKVSYMEYLGSLGNTSELPVQNVKSQKEYLDYLRQLVEYLTSFHQRAQALVQLDLETVENRFEENWNQGTVVGWSKQEFSSETTEEQLLRLGDEKLKNELLSRGLKAGGTDRDRAKRLCSVLLNPERTSKKIQLFDSKATALQEAKLQYLVSHLQEYLDATVRYITRKQTRTVQELMEEIHEEDIEEDEDALYEDDPDDNDMVISNPLNIPLDFDGKPIPYWLYKLHGLGIEYKCEICGNYSYWGRRDFDRHFTQWRHQFGMKSLGIPNTSHFHDITIIDDARRLYEKLQSRWKESVFDEASKEQFEDSQGNVLSKKEYLDLLRQGLL